ncbi:protein MRG1 [Sesamum angolense]|uniref:Protein MRG1 n=1 Tax=Sesamum angolense TaxID=2727404 RepID=A0AAE1T4J5_9LAMI|nr:protein MRG1 [Sesamum angolense]
MSGDTGSSKPISGGTTNNPVKDEAVDASPFQEGEQVLAFHGPCLYDAKVSLSIVLLYRESQLSIKSVLFRYKRLSFIWRNGGIMSIILWDEWLGVDCLLKRTEENVRKQKELKEKHAVEKNAKLGRLSQDKTKNSIGVRGKKRKHEIIEKEVCVPLEKLVNIQIPSTLKKQLVDDHECINQLGQLVKLPRSPSVYEILNKYFDYRVKKDGMIVETVVEIVNGLRCYFDKALPAMLLYKHERLQYEEVIADNVSPSGVYGAEHLLRLFVKLPEMLSCIQIEMETLTELQQRLHDFLRFLQSNQSAFFQSIYQTTTSSEGFDSAVKREDN